MSSIAATLNAHSAQAKTAALAQFDSLAQRYVDGDEPTPAVILETLEASGKSADDLDEAIQAIKATRQQEAEAKRLVEAKAVESARALVAKEPALLAEIAANQALVEAADDVLAARRAELERERQLAQQKRDDTVAPIKQANDAAYARLEGEVARAKCAVFMVDWPETKKKLKEKQKPYIELIGSYRWRLDLLTAEFRYSQSGAERTRIEAEIKQLKHDLSVAEDGCYAFTTQEIEGDEKFRAWQIAGWRSK